MKIVTLNNGEAVTNTVAIADGIQNPHASVIRLVRNYLDDLKEFGRVRFEIEPFDTLGGPQSREVAFLNEHQATLLLTYMRNTDVVRQFKKRLVTAFFTLANAERPTFPQIPQSFAQALQLAANQAKQLEEQAPKVEFFDRLVNKTH
jgi:phage regulator Rha-like protein